MHKHAARERANIEQLIPILLIPPGIWSRSQGIKLSLEIQEMKIQSLRHIGQEKSEEMEPKQNCIFLAKEDQTTLTTGKKKSECRH
jgi:hypothetical protein